MTTETTSWREADETANSRRYAIAPRRLYASQGVRSARELERSVKRMLPQQQRGIDNAVEDPLQRLSRKVSALLLLAIFDADGAA